MRLTSSAFEHNSSIPTLYSCDGEKINPPLTIGDVPENAVSLVLIMDDPDIPESIKRSKEIEVFDHWVVFNIPPETEEIIEGQEPRGVLGTNTAGSVGYFPPCPPDTEHRYVFKVYALRSELSLPEGASKAQVEMAMEGLVLNSAELIGLYERV